MNLNWILQYPDWVFWAALPAFMLHQVEEYIYPGGFREWLNRRVFQSEDKEKPLTKRAAFLINIPLMWTLLGFTAYVGSGNLWISLPVISILFVNAWFHIVTSLVFNDYSPGVYTSIVIFLPLTVYTYSLVLATWQTDFTTIMFSIMFGLLCHMLITIVPRAKKSETESNP